MKKLNHIKAFDNKVEIIDKKINDNGYLVLKCIFARIGIQERFGAEISEDFEASKLYKEYRSPKEIFKKEVLESFQRVVITNDHPNETLTNKNTKYHAIGFVSSIVEVIDNAYLQCEITIYDLSAIDDISSGKVELSAGYLYSIIMVENSEYDYIQTDIKPNHIAIVHAGRCGPVCSIAFDKNSNLNKGENMKKVVFKVKQPDGTDKIIIEIEVSEDSFEAVQSVANTIYEMSSTVCTANKGADEELESLKEEVSSKDEEVTTLKEANDKLQAELDTKKPVAMDSAKIQKIATDLASVMLVAKDCNVDYAGKDTLTIQKEIIGKFNPDLNLDGKTNEYVGYAFDNISIQLKGADSSYKQAMTIKTSPAFDEEAKKVDEAKDGFDSKYGGNQ